MKRTLLSLLIVSSIVTACRKTDILLPVSAPCIEQKANPTGKSYTTDSVVSYICTNKHCGIMQLSSKNYWIYEDSLFADGDFVRVQYDTLRFQTCKKTLSDGLVWWESTLYIGLPTRLYASDSSFFGLADRFFTPGIMDVKKEYGLFEGDSIKYLTSFDDAAATCRSLKITNAALKTPAGDFNEYIYFEKLARNYRRDQLYFKPGIGIMKYIQEKAPMGTRTLKLQQVSTLVSYHVE